MAAGSQLGSGGQGLARWQLARWQITRWQVARWQIARWQITGWQAARWRMVAGLGLLAALALLAPRPAGAQALPPMLADETRTGSATWLARLDAAPPAPLRDALPPAEPALRQAVLQAMWPADIVRLADAYLGRFEAQAWAAEARALREQAQPVAQLLRRPEVQLFRSAFVDASTSGLAAVDVRLAALGDTAAALRLAQPSPQVPAGSKRQLGWLQFAAALGSDQAAYALALHYRRESQPLLAAQHEALALTLGHVPALSLDHVRK